MTNLKNCIFLCLVLCFTNPILSESFDHWQSMSELDHFIKQQHKEINLNFCSNPFFRSHLNCNEQSFRLGDKTIDLNSYELPSSTKIQSHSETSNSIDVQTTDKITTWTTTPEFENKDFERIDNWAEKVNPVDDEAHNNNRLKGETILEVFFALVVIILIAGCIGCKIMSTRNRRSDQVTRPRPQPQPLLPQNNPQPQLPHATQEPRQTRTHQVVTVGNPTVPATTQPSLESTFQLYDPPPSYEQLDDRRNHPTTFAKSITSNEQPSSTNHESSIIFHQLSSSSNDQPSTNFYQSSTSTEHTSATFCQTSSSRDQQSVTFCQTITSRDQPSVTFYQPSTSYNQPTTSYDQPSTSYVQPSTSYGHSSYSHDQSSTSYHQPSSSYDQPSTSFGHSSYGHDHSSTSCFQSSVSYEPSSGCDPSNAGCDE